MRIVVLISAVLALCTIARSQATLFTEDFEAGSTFTSSGAISPNDWLVATCAGNGVTLPGTQAMYISQGGATTSDCGPTGAIQYSFANSPSGILETYTSTTIDATCASAIQVNFDYTITSTFGEDFAELAYSTDGGTSWIPVGSPLATSAAWTNTTIALPALLDFSTFLLGFKFTYNDANNAGFPLAVDNITVSGTDTQAPVISTCAPDTVSFVDIQCQSLVLDFTNLVIVSDNCSSILTYSQTPSPGTIINGTSNQPVQIEVFDESGNSSTCSFVIVPKDTISTTITCPPNQPEPTNGSCEALLNDYTNLADVLDNCNDPYTISQSPIPGTSVSANQTITLTLNGGIPSTTKQCTFTVELIDTTAPTVTCPSGSTEYVNASCDFVLPDYSSSFLWSDNCETLISNMTVSQTPVATTPIQTNATVTIMMTDPSGNSNSCDFIVTVLDTISPTIVCPNDTTHPTDLNCQAPMRNYVPLASVMDNCTASGLLVYSQTPIVASLFSIPTIVTITVEDASGNQNSCQFTVTPIDTTAPTLTCPQTVQFSTNNACSYLLADESGIVTVDDNCTSSTNLILTQTPAAGVSIPAGNSQISFEFEDESGNSSSCIVDVTVIDDVDPVITLCPPSVASIVDVNCSATLADYVGNLTAIDNCTTVGNLTITQSPVSGTVISASQIVTMTVTDEEGNSEQCAFTVSISDTTSPIVTCPADIDLAINSNCEYVTPDFGPSVTGTDNCSSFANMTITQNPLAGTTQNGTTAVLITLTDEQGNSSQCFTTISPIDNQAPQITCPTPATVDNGINCDFVLPYYGTSAPVIDNCNNFTITQSPAQGTTVQTGTTIITLTVTDAGGNQATCDFPLLVTESQAPTINCPSNISSCDPVVTYVDPTFNDNCFAFLTQTDGTGFSSGDAFPIGVTTLEYTVADSSGNNVSCTFDVEVLDYPNANIPLDTLALCGVNSAFLQADPANGEWTILSGSGAFNNQFANETGVNNLPFGTSEFIWTVATASCGTASDTITVINSLAPSPANVQDTFIACGLTEANLFTATPSSGSGMWTTLQGGTILNPTSPVTTVTNLASGWNDLIWTISAVGCPSNSDTLRILSSGNVQIFQADTAICFDDFEPFSLTGTPIGSGQIADWSFQLGSGTFSNTTSSTTTVNSIQLGENTIVYTIDYEDCPEDSYALTVIANYCDEFDPVFPTVITPNGDGKNDVFEVQSLEKIYPNCHVVIYNRWGSVVFESTGYTDPWNGRYKGEPLPMGTYFFKLELNDEENRIFNGPISIIH